jgi:hypothetical protein
MGAYSATFIYVKNVVVLMYFIVEGRINTFGEEIQPSDWLKLSEARSARARAGAAAAQRIALEIWRKWRKSGIDPFGRYGQPEEYCHMLRNRPQ